MRIRRSRSPRILAALSLALATLALSHARADVVVRDLIVNGDFDAGTVGSIPTGWHSLRATIPETDWRSAPEEPAWSVAADDAGTGRHAATTQGLGMGVLYQDFAVPAGVTSAVLRFTLGYARITPADATPWSDLPPLSWFSDHAAVDNAAIAVDFQSALSDPTEPTPVFPIAIHPSTVLFTAFATRSTSPLDLDPTALVVDVTPLLAAHPGETLRLRAELGRFGSPEDVRLDDVSLVAHSVAAVPEPGGLAMGVIGTLLVVSVTACRRAARGRTRPR
jgi:hypothetical protein